MKKIIALIIIAIAMFSQASSKKVYVEYDMASFWSDSSKVKFEFYYSFPDTSFKYVQCEEGFKGDLNFKLVLKPEHGSEIVESWTASALAASDKPALKNIMYGTRNLVIPKGKYKGELIGRDDNDSTTKILYKFDFSTRAFPEDRISISDIQLSVLLGPKPANISPAMQMFAKDDFVVYPNPSATFISNDPIVNFYYELYGMKSFDSTGYTINYKVRDGAKREVFAFDKEYPAVSDKISRILDLPVNVVPSGVYYLELTAKTNKTGDTAKIQKKFYLLNPSISADLQINFTESMTFEASEFATMDAERVEIEYKQAKIIANTEEKNSFEKLTELKGKQRFLYKFWTTRNTDTNSTINKKLIEYRELIDYCNNFYGTANKEGWETDRGRVTLKYGKPTQIDKSTMQENQRNYETWYYDQIQGGAQFYFVEMTDGGGYRMCHSTATGEFYDSNWFNNNVVIRSVNNDDLIRKITGSGGNR